MRRTDRICAVICVVLLLVPWPALAQSAEAAKIGRNPFRAVTGVWRNLKWTQESPFQAGNSGRLDSLLRAGQLYLSLQDAVALALENNLDIEYQRYGSRLAAADVRRASAGAPNLRGVTTSIAGSSTASSYLGGQSNLTTGTGAVSSYTLEPTVSFGYNWSHLTTPQTSSFVTGTSSLINETSTANSSIQKGFLTGTLATLAWNNTFTSTNSGRSDFNPSKSTNFSLTVTQHLLEGFSRAVNSRGIRVAQNNVKVSDLVFRHQVMATVANVVNMYWDLVSYNQNVRVQQQAVDLARRLWEDNKKQVEVGTLAPIEVVRAEAQMASSQQALTIAETQLLQQEAALKNVLSRTGVASALIAEARIVPTDQIRVPSTESVEPVQDLMAAALENRPELAESRLMADNARIGLAATKSQMKPTLDLVGTLQNNGLAGQVNALPIPSVTGGAATPRNPSAVDAYFLGGYGTALAQALRRNFPNYTIGFNFNVPLTNKTAQADMVRDQVLIRQLEIRQQQIVNQIRLDVTNALISVQQARGQYESATKTRLLQEQTLAAEEKKFAVGASTIFFVVQAQRDLAVAQQQEVTALNAYSKARVALDQATGRVLDRYNVQIDEARSGSVSRPADPPPVGR